MRIRATFIGTNGSMGFVHGRDYVLQVLVDIKTAPGYSMIKFACPRIVSADPGGEVVCPYGSWDAFWKNWKKLP